MKVISKRRFTLAAVVIGILALAAAWWLGSPLFLDNEVSEDFPLASSASIPDEMTREEVEAEMEEAAEAPDVGTNEPMPDNEGGGGNPVQPTAPVGLSTLFSGSFVDADEFHQGEGTATIYQLDDGSRVLRLEDFEVTNGPDLRVLLASGGTPSTSEELGDYIELGALKGNIGNQNYEIPDDVDLERFSSVVIYCKPFHVVFSFATIGSPQA